MLLKSRNYLLKALIILLFSLLPSVERRRRECWLLLKWSSSVRRALLVLNRLGGRPCHLLRLLVPAAWWSYCIRRSLPESKIYWHRLIRFRSGECRILRGVGVGTEALCRDDSIPACVQSVPIVRTLYFRTRIEIRKLWPV